MGKNGIWLLPWLSGKVDSGSFDTPKKKKKKVLKVPKRHFLNLGFTTLLKHCHKMP